MSSPQGEDRFQGGLMHENKCCTQMLVYLIHLHTCAVIECVQKYVRKSTILQVMDYLLNM